MSPAEGPDRRHHGHVDFLLTARPVLSTTRDISSGTRRHDMDARIYVDEQGQLSTAADADGIYTGEGYTLEGGEVVCVTQGPGGAAGLVSLEDVPPRARAALAALRDAQAQQDVLPGETERRHHWTSVAVLVAEDMEEVTDTATRRAVLARLKARGSVADYFLAPVGEPHEDAEDPSTWGPRAEDIDWTGFDASRSQLEDVAQRLSVAVGLEREGVPASELAAQDSECAAWAQVLGGYEGALAAARGLLELNEGTEGAST